MPRVAQTIAHTLKAYGTEYFFFVTGGDQDLWIALDDAGIRLINCRSEKAATYMADGYARISGKPGFVYGQYGPGVSNVAAGLADAYWAMSPVISLTSSTRTTSRDRYEYQELDQLPMNAPVTRWNRAIVRPERAAEMVRAAIRAATGSPPGPVHLEIPADMLRADIDPVLIAGNGALLSGAWDEVQALAEMLSIPVATSMGGKGSIREDHDLALGVIGRYSRKVANDIVREADLALVVGCRLGGLVSDSYTVPSAQARILHIDVDTNVLGTTYREEISVQADAKLALQALIDEVGWRGIRRTRTAWAQQAHERVKAWTEQVQRAAKRPPEQPIHPAAVMLALRAALAPTDIVVADTGYMGAWTGALYPVTAPGRTYIRAAGSLGWAFPAALGAALAAEDRRAVCVSGDGGIGYHLGEIETALRCQIPLLVMVLNNSSLAFEYHEQKFNWNNRIVPQVNDFSNVDYSAVARAFGAGGRQVTDTRELADDIDDGLTADRLTLLHVRVDKEVHAPVSVYERVLPRS